MVALRAVLLYTAIHFAAKSLDAALATRVASYARWSESRRRKWSQRPLYHKVLRKLAANFAVKVLLDATLQWSSAYVRKNADADDRNHQSSSAAISRSVQT